MDIFRRNRKKMMGLVYQLDEFSEDELIEALKRLVGDDVSIDGVQTIGGYLSDLREMGVLTERDGRFKVVRA